MSNSEFDKANIVNKLQIRFANYSNKADGQAIIGLLNQYAKEAQGGGKALSRYTVENLINELNHIDGANSVLAFSAGKPVGLINSFRSFSTFKCKPVLNIHDVVVHQDYRRKGIAKQMFDFLEEYARENSYCKLTLEVLNKNQAAMELYKSIGFNAYELIPSMGQAFFWEKPI